MKPRISAWTSSDLGTLKPSDRDPADRLLDSAWAGLAIWTLCCHAVVFLGGSLLVLVPLGLFLASAGAVASFYMAGTAGTTVGQDPAYRPPLAHRWELGALTCLVLILGFSPAFELAWGLALLFVLWGLAREWRGGGSLRISQSAPSRPRILLLMVLIAVIATLSIRRADEDDSFYVHLATHAADFPSEPLLSRDSLHARPDLPLWLGTNRLRSHELMAAAFSWATGVPAIHWLHLVLPIGAAALIVLGYGRLYRILAPDRWVACLVVTLAYFLLVGEGPRGFSNFGLARLHQGKSIFVSAALPLLFAYSLEFLRGPDWRGGLRLALVQVASLGLTPSAIWVGPAAVGAAMLTALPRTVEEWRIAIRGVCWVLAIPLAWAPYVHRAVLRTGILSTPLPSADQPLTAIPLEDLTATEVGRELGTQAFEQALGTGAWSLAGLAFMLGTWTFCRSRLTRRFALVLPAILLLVYWNPWAAKTLAGSLTGTLTYWRIFWIVPFPALLALALTSGLLALPGDTARWKRWVTVLLPTSLVLLSLPSVRLLDPANRADLAPLQLKAPPEREVARAVVGLASAGESVVVPFRVAPWIGTFPGHPNAELTRLQYLRPDLGAASIRRRLALTYLVSGSRIPAILDRELLAQGIRSFPLMIEAGEIQVVCLSSLSPFRDWIREDLLGLGFEMRQTEPGFEIWVRSEKDETLS